MSQPTGFDQILDPHRRRRVAILHHAEDLLAILQPGVNHLLCIGCGECHRLFDDDVMTGLDRLDSHLGVQPVRCANVHDIEGEVAGKQLAQAAEKRHISVGIDGQLRLRARVT